MGGFTTQTVEQFDSNGMKIIYTNAQTALGNIEAIKNFLMRMGSLEPDWDAIAVTEFDSYDREVLEYAVPGVQIWRHYAGTGMRAMAWILRDQPHFAFEVQGWGRTLRAEFRNALGQSFTAILIHQSHDIE